jgi:parallel beta-helix repeat protein
MKKMIAFGIILMFLLMTVSSTNGINLEKQSIEPMSFGNTLYVGGNGTGNYSSIQDAINDSENGDTIYVYDDSSPYFENIIVYKSITLRGENKETTVIDGSDSEAVVNIASDNVILSGFTIRNHGSYFYPTDIIFVQSNYNVISGNIIKVNDDDNGINISYSEYTTITGNIITRYTSESWSTLFVYEMGILIDQGKNNNISRNIIKNFTGGIVFCYSNNYNIYGNTLINNTYGINPAGFSINDVISLNNISGSWWGIYALNCFNYKIIKNNFLDNRRNAGFGYYLGELFIFGFKYRSIREIRQTIKWDGNYWNGPRSFPKLIFGRLPPYGIIHWVQFDLHPAKEPYYIEV